jgi:hypothetical protein
MFENFIESLEEFGKRKREMLYSSLIDIFFLFVYFFATQLIFENIAKHVLNAFSIVGQNRTSLQELSGGMSELLTKLPNLPGFNAEFKSLLFFIALLFLTVCIIYTIFQYFSWRLIAKDKSRRFMKFFIISSVFWVILYSAISFFSSIRELFAVLNGTQVSGNMIFSFLYLLMVYLAFTSYSLIGRKKALRTFLFAFRIKPLLCFLELLVLFVMTNSILIIADSIHSYFALTIGIPVVFGLISFSKLHIYRTINQEK